MCPTKKLVKQQEKPQVEQEKKPQVQIKINHEDGGDMGKKKKKTRRRGVENQDQQETSPKLNAMIARTRDTMPRSVLSSLRRRLKQVKRGKAMGSTT
jgi:hypothetical protein